MSNPPTADAEHSTGAPLVSGVEPKPSDVVRLAHDVLAEDGVLLSLNKIHKMLRRMWADESAAERRRVGNELRLMEYESGLRDGHERLMTSDPVGEEAAELVDWVRGCDVYVTSGRVKELDHLARMSS